MKTQVFDVTPEMAQHWLKQCNTINFRELNGERVRKYSVEMIRDCWDENGVPIIFNDQQQLLDGQHRLAAVVKSGKTVRMLVVTGVKSGCKTIDRGMGRTVGQWCKASGYQHGRAIASIARLVGLYECEKWGSSHPKDGWGDSELFEYIERNSESLMLCARLSGNASSVLTHSILGAILHIGCERANPYDYSDAVWFVEKLKSGEGLRSIDPVFHLRNKMLAETQRAKIGLIMKRAIATIAWNKTIAGETSQVLAVRLTGPTAMQMPSKILAAQKMQKAVGDLLMDECNKNISQDLYERRR